LASLNGTFSHFYTTPASHQPNPLGFSQRYIVTLLHESRFASAKPSWLLSVVHCRTSTRIPLRISQTLLASLSGTLSHFYTTPASHQPNPLGFSEPYIVALLNDSRFASAKPSWLLSAVHCLTSTRILLRISQTLLASLSSTLSHFYTTPASHQANPLGFSQRYIFALLHNSRFASAKPSWLLSAVHCRTSTRIPLRISQTLLASLSGTLSHFYTTPASHQPNLLASLSGILSHFYTTPAQCQPNLLGFAQRYIVALLHDSRFASAKSLGQLSAARRCLSKRYSLHASHTSWVSTSGILPRLYMVTTLLQLDFFGYLSGTLAYS